MPSIMCTCKCKNHRRENQSNNELLEAVSDLRKELQTSRSQTKQLEDQIAVLVSLIKRSWHGDKTANLHLANIVGVELDGMFDMNLANEKSTAVKNWERLSLKLLQKEYDAVKKEIQRRQQEYIEGRSLYMEELMASHQREMTQFSKRLGASSVANLQQQVDKQFLTSFNKGLAKRPPSGVRQRVRSRSAGMQRTQSNNNNSDVQNVTLKELFIEPTGPKNWSANNNDCKTAQSHGEGDAERFAEKLADRPWVRQDSYDNPHRYVQSNLFDINDVVDASEKKSRPCSAVLQRRQDYLRSRPKSAGYNTEKISPIAVKQERPLKYETTYPIPRKDNKNQQDSTDESNLTSARDMNQNGQEQVAQVKKPRSKSALPNSGRINKFEADLKKMYTMEDEFRRTTFDLQKRLGINEQGMILY